MRFFSKKYKFTDKKISWGGVLSSLFAVLACICLASGVYISFKAKGNGGTNVGILGAGAFLLSLVGFFVGLRSFKKDNIFLGFPWFGVVVNALIWLVMFLIILVGI